jgi:hypothetical protein
LLSGTPIPARSVFVVMMFIGRLLPVCFQQH